MISVLTAQTRTSLVRLAVSGTSSIGVPQYLEVGTGPGNASATDETVSGPLVPRIPCIVSTVTTNTTDDTVRFVGILTTNSAQSITNLGLFDVGTSAPLGSVSKQVNYPDTQVQLVGYGNFPTSSFPFDIQVGREVMTAVSGNGADVFYVDRAVNGTVLTLSGIAIGTQIVGGNNTSNGTMFLKSSFGGLPLDPGSTVEFIIDLQFI